MSTHGAERRYKPACCPTLLTPCPKYSCGDPRVVESAAGWGLRANPKIATAGDGAALGPAMVSCIFVLSATSLLGMSWTVRSSRHHDPTMALWEARRPGSSSCAPSVHRRLWTSTALFCVEERRMKVYKMQWISSSWLPSSSPTSSTHSSFDTHSFITNTPDTQSFISNTHPTLHLYFRIPKQPPPPHQPITMHFSIALIALAATAFAWLVATALISSRTAKEDPPVTRIGPRA